ncbi:MAG: thioredoxin-like domain-containing protein, partial [Bacteroides sp.]
WIFSTFATQTFNLSTDMKKLIFLLLCIAATEYAYGQAKITVRTIAATDSTVYVSAPVESFPLGITDTVVVKNGQAISLNVAVGSLSTINLRNAKQYTTLIIEPSKEYAVTFDYTRTPVVQVDDASQQLFNEVFQKKDFYQYEFVRNFSAAPLDTVGERMLTQFETLMQQDKQRFEAVEMSSAKRAYIDAQLELYWMGSLSRAIKSNYYTSMRSGTPMRKGYEQLWKQIYTKYPLREEMIPSPLLAAYADMLLLMKKKCANDTLQPKTYTEYLQTKHNGLYTAITNANVKRAVIAGMLYFDCINNSTYDVAILPFIDRFNQAYPDNIYQAKFATFVKEIKVFQEESKRAFPPQVHFVTDGNSLNTFKELIARFHGKPLFVDFWFSTCGPCCKQFKHNVPLKNFLKEQGIEMLYVSIDRQETEWHNAIKHFNLEGHHIRATKKLHQDLYNTYQVGSFPRYMVIDSNGNIVVSRAKEPDEGKALYKQIKEAIH